ncbi:MAG: hypothetical protein QOH21_951 [Acidobacteriota bacterium]|nr:hypothetical protein [Acidobacteriota bacterium]
MATITVAVEGVHDAEVARRLLVACGHAVGPVYNAQGKSRLDRSLSGYNNAARQAPWLVLRDLDRDGECAPELRRKLLPDPAQFMTMRIPVRAVETWLLADRRSFAKYFRVSTASVPRDVEAIADPKRLLVDIVRTSSSSTVRNSVVPARGTSAAVGPGYTAAFIDFVVNHWDVDAAAEESQSLASCLAALRRLV